MHSSTKVGTRVLGEAANWAGTPFFVVAESYKWFPDAQSITADGAFETIPNALVTDFFVGRYVSSVTPRYSPAPNRADQMAFKVSTASFR